MNEKSKKYSPLKTHSYSFIGNTSFLSSYKPLFPPEESKTTSTHSKPLNTLIALLNKKTPSTASQEPSNTSNDHSFGYKPDVSPFSLEDIKNVKKTSIIYGNISYLNSSTSNESNKRDISLIPEKVFLLPKYSIHNKYSKNVIEFSYQEDQNVSFKHTMEDKAKTITSFNSNPHNVLFTLFDGHGGDSVSTYLQKHYDKFLRQSLNIYTNNIQQCLIDSFIQIDNTLQAMNFIRTGSTGCVLYITQEKGKKVLYCANIGDTRCTLFTASTIERLSYDHRACDLHERERIYNNGGFVVNGRVMGRLMLSRTFGDFELKNVGVIAEPYVYRKELDEGVGVNQFVVMACDGIWDVLNEEGIRQCIVNICNDKENLKKNVTSTICDELIQSALAEGAWDNLSVFAIKL